jgi:proline iminopeptidase
MVATTINRGVCGMYDPSIAREGFIQVEKAKLFYREIGQGQPIIMLHGGPDFDHGYLLPDMDRLADAYRLIYYDQRGRGKYGGDVQPDDVSIKSEVEDLERLRQYFQLDSMAVLGHSWGGVLAMQYAIHHSERVSHMILMNTAAASQGDYFVLRQEVLRRKAVHQDAINALASSIAYQEGDPDAVAAYYRIQYGTTIKQPEHLDRLMESMRLSFTKETILKGRAIEDQLYKETWSSSEYDLFPRLKQLAVPTLVIHGDYDFIPAACAEHIAQTIPGARYNLVKDSGHFTYIDAPDAARTAIDDFFATP